MTELKMLKNFIEMIIFQVSEQLSTRTFSCVFLEELNYVINS